MRPRAAALLGRLGESRQEEMKAGTVGASFPERAFVCLCAKHRKPNAAPVGRKARLGWKSINHAKQPPGLRAIRLSAINREVVAEQQLAPVGRPNGIASLGQHPGSADGKGYAPDVVLDLGAREGHNQQFGSVGREVADQDVLERGGDHRSVAADGGDLRGDLMRLKKLVEINARAIGGGELLEQTVAGDLRRARDFGRRQRSAEPEEGEGKEG